MQLNLQRGDTRLRVLQKLSACRGGRALPVSLLDCLAEGEKTERRLHNACTSLFSAHLLQKVDGRYQLTVDGARVAGQQKQ